MNKVDREYCNLLKEILDYGRYKESRAGETISLFGKSMRFNLQDGLPLLTTKKVFYKGIIHELLWFLNGDTNIKYLVDNNVHIWDDDAYRYYLELVEKHNSLYELKEKIHPSNSDFIYDNLAKEHDDLNVGGTIMFLDEEEMFDMLNKEDTMNDDIDKNVKKYIDIDDFANSLTFINPLTKEEFIEKVKKHEYLSLFSDVWDLEDIVNNNFNTECEFTLNDYRFGDLGPIYGKQWRAYGHTQFDQIQNIVETLKKNPNDRRMLCIAFNPDVLDDVALPPCHIMFQFYTYELQPIERLAWLCEHSNGEFDEWKTTTHEKMDELNVPRHSLSCSFTMRSNDFCCGNPYNIAQYAMLTYMLCEVCNMIPGELVYNGGDVHVYTNHIEGAKEQLSRNGSEIIPKLKFNRKVTDINDFKYEDFVIEDYYPDPSIKYALNVGL